MIRFPRTHSPRLSAAGRPASEGSGAGAAGGPGVGSPGLAVRFLRRRGQPRVGRFVLLPAWAASQAEPACSCGLAFLPSPPFFPLFKGGAVPSARVPLPPRLRGSRHLDPRRAVLGSKEQPRPLGPLPAARPPAGWPLSHRFHRSRLRFPAPSPSLPSLILGTVQLAARPAPRSTSLHPCYRQGAPPPYCRVPHPHPQVSPPGSRAGHGGSTGVRLPIHLSRLGRVGPPVGPYPAQRPLSGSCSWEPRVLGWQFCHRSAADQTWGYS